MGELKKYINNKINNFLREYQSFELYNSTKSAITEIIDALSIFIKSKNDIDILFSVMKNILSDIIDSEITPLGHNFDYNTKSLFSSIKKSKNLQDFIKPFIYNQTNDIDEMIYFRENIPLSKNSAVTNERESFISKLSFNNIEKLKYLCKKLSIDLNTLDRNNFIDTFIDEIPVFISINYDSSKKSGFLEFNIIDKDNPYEITMISKKYARQLDLFFQKILKSSVNSG